MKFHAFLPALLVVGSLTLATAPARATFGLLGGLGSVCDTPSFGGGDGDLFGSFLGGSGDLCATPVVHPPVVIGLGSVCDAPRFGGDASDLSGSSPLSGRRRWFGGGLDNDCGPGGGGTGGGGTSPVPEPGSIALLLLGATALGGTVLRRARK